MGFNSSLLKSSNNITSIHELTVPKDRSGIYDILEFNDELHDIIIADKIRYYRTICESKNGIDINISESVIGDAVKVLTSIIEKVIVFVRNIVRTISGTNVLSYTMYKKYLKEFESTNSLDFNKNSWALEPNRIRKVNVFHYPNILEIDSGRLKVVLKDILKELELVCKNESNRKVNSKTREDAFRALTKMINDLSATNKSNHKDIDSSREFNKYVKENLCYKEEVEMDFDTYYRYYRDIGNNLHDLRAFVKRASEFKTELDNAKRMVSNAVINTDSQKSHAKALVSQISEITMAYENFIYSIHRMENACVSYHSKFFNAYVLCNNPINEAGYIHGEEFNSDTLFDNEDLRDFNRTEWLDISLTTECFEAKYEVMEAYDSIALKEANILMDEYSNKFNRLVAMREAEGQSLSEKIDIIIKNIMEFLNKFIASMTDRSKLVMNELKQNATLISKPFTLKKVSSNGDILAGMLRVKSSLNIIPYNYDTLKDDLKDKETFFKSRILPNMKNTSQYSKRRLDWKDGMSITEYCKAYFGAGMPEDGYSKCEFGVEDLEANRSGILAFLNTPSNSFSCKNDLRALENEAKKIASAPQPSSTENKTTSNNTDNSGNQNTQDAKNESMYYSVLYHTWLTEAEIEMGEKPENADQNDNQNTELANAYKVYMDCYKDIILAKMTASEFIYSELSQIVRAHYKSYGGGVKKSENNQNAAP